MKGINIHDKVYFLQVHIYKCMHLCKFVTVVEGNKLLIGYAI